MINPTNYLLDNVNRQWSSNVGHQKIQTIRLDPKLAFGYGRKIWATNYQLSPSHHRSSYVY